MFPCLTNVRHRGRTVPMSLLALTVGAHLAVTIVLIAIALKLLKERAELVKEVNRLKKRGSR